MVVVEFVVPRCGGKRVVVEVKYDPPLVYVEPPPLITPLFPAPILIPPETVTGIIFIEPLPALSVTVSLIV